MSEAGPRLEVAVKYLVQAVVAHPDDVRVEVRSEGGEAGHRVKVMVHADDVGRVIGREGRTIRGLRQILALTVPTLGAPVTLDLEG